MNWKSTMILTMMAVFFGCQSGDPHDHENGDHSHDGEEHSHDHDQSEHHHDQEEFRVGDTLSNEP